MYGSTVKNLPIYVKKLKKPERYKTENPPDKGK
jgi:hypothetical protein